jgi:membrane-associated protease RseP (regulator of RpoE activity)
MIFTLGAIFLLLGLLLSVALHELGHMYFARKFKVKVTDYMIGFGPAIFSKVNKKGTNVGIRAIPLGGYIKMIGMFPEGSKLYEDEKNLLNKDEVEFYKIHPIKKIIIMIAGPMANFILAIIFTAIALLGLGVPSPSLEIKQLPECINLNVNECIEATAYKSGLQVNDKILSINNKKINSWSDFIIALDRNKGEEINLLVSRANKEVDIIIPVLAIEDRGYIGVAPEIKYKRESIYALYGVIVDNLFRVFKAVAGLPERMVEITKIVFTDKERDPNGPIGVVGLGRISGEIAQSPDPTHEKILMLLLLLAGLNMSLFVFNLIPLVPLDGGNAFAAIIEYIKKIYYKMSSNNKEYYLDPAKFIYITYFVAIILMSSSLLLMIADIIKPIYLKNL